MLKIRCYPQLARMKGYGPVNFASPRTLFLMALFNPNSKTLAIWSNKLAKLLSRENLKATSSWSSTASILVEVWTCKLRVSQDLMLSKRPFQMRLRGWNSKKRRSELASLLLAAKWLFTQSKTSLLTRICTSILKESSTSAIEFLTSRCQSTSHLQFWRRMLKIYLLTARLLWVQLS